MAGERAWICGMGMVTPVGDCVAQTASSVRAGINRYQESSVYNKRFQPMTLALLSEEDLPPLNDVVGNSLGLTSRQIRILRIVDSAIKEVLQSLPADAEVPLYLAGPEPLFDRPPALTSDFFDHLINETNVPIDRAASILFPTGRAGGLLALQTAIEFLNQNDAEHVLIGGVDSYLDLALLATLDAEDRVLAEGAMDAFAPGEGCGFILLCSDRIRDKQLPKPSTAVYPPGIALESGHRYSDQPYKGDGLAGAIATAVENVNGLPIKTVFASLNGESYSAKEWGVACTRSSSAFDIDFRLEHPADCFGDIGAACGPVLLGLAGIGIRKGYYQNPALIWCSSEGPQRAAVCVSIETS